MSTIVMNKRDEFIMKLVHYFITEENYSPIIVNGVKDEIWLENTDGPYRIIRINSNNIFNKEQLEFDYFKIKSIVRQIKRKTLSFSVNTLNILLDVNEDLEVEGTKNICPAPIYNNSLEITNKDILEAFPKINEKLLKDSDGVELILNVTKDINHKTEKENKVYERTFSPKKIVITPILLIINIAMFILLIGIDGFGALANASVDSVYLLGGNFTAAIQNGEVWRLITSMFLHYSLIHLAVNMYSLYIVGSQVESFMGRVKYILIYFISGICGSLLSSVMNVNAVSAGASGALFGLTGALLYFGYHYRTYLGSALKNQIIPIVVANLAIGFMIPGIDNACHIGGLVGGVLTTMALGVDGRSKKSEKINGTICLFILIIALAVLLYMR